jgi:hypothetical protein
LQSRGHVLTGGPRERHFDLFKRWGRDPRRRPARVCADGATLYGEWLYAKHTVFYDQLPHYFLEFDLRDRDGMFWSTARRQAHLAACGAAPRSCASVPVIWAGVVDDPRALPALVTRRCTSRRAGATIWRRRPRPADVPPETGRARDRSRRRQRGPVPEGRGRRRRHRSLQVGPRQLPHQRPRLRQPLAGAPDRAQPLADGVDLFAGEP